MSYLITHTTELFHNLFFRTSECIRVIETDMKLIYNLSNKSWAGLFCSATYGYDIVPTLVKILRDNSSRNLNAATTSIGPSPE